MRLTEADPRFRWVNRNESLELDLSHGLIRGWSGIHLRRISLIEQQLAPVMPWFLQGRIVVCGAFSSARFIATGAVRVGESRHESYRPYVVVLFGWYNARSSGEPFCEMLVVAEQGLCSCGIGNGVTPTPLTSPVQLDSLLDMANQSHQFPLRPKRSGNWHYAEEQMWITDIDPGFVDAASGKCQLRPDAEVFQRLPGFRPVPFEKMGPQGEDRTRRTGENHSRLKENTK